MCAIAEMAHMALYGKIQTCVSVSPLYWEIRQYNVSVHWECSCQVSGYAHSSSCSAFGSYGGYGKYGAYSIHSRVLYRCTHNEHSGHNFSRCIYPNWQFSASNLPPHAQMAPPAVLSECECLVIQHVEALKHERQELEARSNFWCEGI